MPRARDLGRVCLVRGQSRVPVPGAVMVDLRGTRESDWRCTSSGSRDLKSSSSDQDRNICQD